MEDTKAFCVSNLYVYKKTLIYIYFFMIGEIKMEIRWLEAMLVAQKLRKDETVKTICPKIDMITAVDIFVIYALKENEKECLGLDDLKAIVDKKYGIVLEATNSLKRLENLGLINIKHNPGCVLTDRGKRVAEKIEQLINVVRKTIEKDSLLLIIDGLSRY